jgi:hypothetical protein
MIKYSLSWIYNILLRKWWRRSLLRRRSFRSYKLLIIHLIKILLFFISILIYQINIWPCNIILIYYNSFTLSRYSYFINWRWNIRSIKNIFIICLFIFLSFSERVGNGHLLDIGFISALITYNRQSICRNKHFYCSWRNTLFAFKFFSSETIWHFCKNNNIYQNNK